jgi:WS/DGAT/MGAT family acyltransferase
MQKISPSDALFLNLDSPTTPMTIGGLHIFDPTTAGENFELKRDLRAYIESRLHLAPNLRRKLVFHPFDLEEPRLVDASSFDLDDHLHFRTLASPNNWASLKSFVAKIIEQPLDMDRPLWEFTIVDGLSDIEGVPEKAFGLISKFHHSVFDGGSTGATLWQFMQDAPGQTVAPPEQPWQPGKDVTLYDWTMSSMSESVKLWGQSMEAMQGFSAGIMAVMNRPKDEAPKVPKQGLTAPKARFSQALTSERTWDTISFPMAELQKLRLALGKPKMNDLFLTVIAGGIRRYLLKTDELPETPMLCVCPVSVRENNPLEGGNYLSALRVSLFTDIADPIERLQAISASTESAKATVQTLGKDFAAHTLATAHYTARKSLISGLHSLPEKIDLSDLPPLANVVVSNAPPPKGGHYFSDCRVVTSSGFGPVFNMMGLIHAVTGVDFESTISVTAGKEILPDTEAYMACIRESYDELTAAANSAKPATLGEPKAQAENPKRQPVRKTTVKKTAEVKSETKKSTTRKPARRKVTTQASTSQNVTNITQARTATASS